MKSTQTKEERAKIEKINKISQIFLKKLDKVKRIDKEIKSKEKEVQIINNLEKKLTNL